MQLRIKGNLRLEHVVLILKSDAWDCFALVMAYHLREERQLPITILAVCRIESSATSLFTQIQQSILWYNKYPQ